MILDGALKAVPGAIVSVGLGELLQIELIVPYTDGQSQELWGCPQLSIINTLGASDMQGSL